MTADWKWLRDATWLWKSHFVPSALAGELEEELDARAAEMKSNSAIEPEVRAAAAKGSIWTKEPTPPAGVFFDVPGMCLVKRSTRRVELDGLSLEIPSQDWYQILSEVALLPERRFKSGAAYYKMHSRFYCVVLTPELRRALISGMTAQMAEAQVEGEEDDRRFAKGIDEANARLAGEGVAIVSPRAQAIAAARDGKKGEN